MGGRGASSLSSSGIDISVGVDADYPSEMNSLFNEYGTISLKPRDYAGYTRDEVEAFMASLPYEVRVVFAPDGSVSGLMSDWDAEGVNMTVDQLASRVKTNQPGHVDFHNHPIPADAAPDGTYNIQTPSPKDLDSWCVVLDNRYNTSHLPTSFAVRSQDGYTFRLDYVGDKIHARFNEKFREQHEESRKLAHEYAEKHGAPYARFVADQIAARDDLWLRANAGEYGFRYTSNWDKAAIV